NKIVKEIGEGTVGTVGELNVSPNASNVIPGEVNLSLDIRSNRKENLQEVEKRITIEKERIERLYKMDIEITKVLHVEPVHMSKEILDIMEYTVDKLGYNHIKMNSGAGHDTMIMARIADTSLIFVPSKNGLSHHPDE